MNVPVGQPSQHAAAQAPTPRTDRRILINTGALTLSSLWRIGLSFVLQLLIANRLGAVGLGQYTTALAYLNVCQVLSELGLPQLLVRDLASAPGRRQSHFQAALTAQFMAALVVWGLLVGLAFLLPYQPATRHALIAITASLPFYAISSVCMTIFQSGERMELIMGVEMLVNILIVAASSWVLWRGGGVIHLAAVMIGTQALSAALYLWKLKGSRLLVSDEDLDRGPSLGTQLRHWAQTSRSFYGLALSNVLLQRIDILLLSVVTGEVVTGIYSAGYLIVRIFITLSQAYWQALYPTLSRLRRTAVEQYRLLSRLGLRYGLMALLFASVLGSSLAQPLLRLIFHSDLYGQSAGVLQVLVWVVPLYFLAAYAVSLLLVEDRPALSLSTALVHLVAVLLLLPLLALRWQALGAAVAVLIGVALSVVAGLMILRRSGIAVDLRQLWLLWLAAWMALGVMQLGESVLPQVAWMVRILVAGTVYGGLLWWGQVLSGADLRFFQKALQR